MRNSKSIVTIVIVVVALGALLYCMQQCNFMRKPSDIEFIEESDVATDIGVEDESDPYNDEFGINSAGSMSPGFEDESSPYGEEEDFDENPGLISPSFEDNDPNEDFAD